MQKHGVLKLLCRAGIVASLLLAGVLTPVSKADAYEGCQKRMIHADRELHKYIAKHCYESRQDDHWRHELREAREWCWKHRHRWWNEDERRWHTDRDWSDRDHDTP